MPTKKSYPLHDESSSFSHLEALVCQLQGCVDRLKLNADRMAGDIFHHDELFADPELGRLDAKIEVIIEDLRKLTRLSSEE